MNFRLTHILGVLVLLCACAPVAPAEDWSRVKADVQRLLASGEPEQRTDAILALTAANCLEAARMLVGLIDMPDSAQERAEAEVEAYEKEYMAAAERLNKVAANQGGMVSTSDAAKMKAMEERMQSLCSRLDDLSQLSRDIVRALSKFTDRPALEWLLKDGVGDASARVRTAVVRALGLLLAQEPDPNPALIGRLDDKEGRVRAAAVDALRDRNVVGAQALVLSRLDDEAWQVRVAAIEALAGFGQRASVGPLIARIQKETGRLREDVDRALAALTGVTLGGDPLAWKGWWEANGAAWEAGTLEKKAAPEETDDGPGQTMSFFGITTKSKNVLFVLDISGSMNEPANAPATVDSGPGVGISPKGNRKIDVARAELHRAISLLPKDAVFNLIFYSTDIKIFSPSSLKADEAAKTKARKYIDTLNPDGGTNIHDALEKAFHFLKKDAENYDKGADTIFFLTDGKPTVGKILAPDKILARVREWNKDRRIRVHAIGVGDHDKDLMKHLAEDNGGTYVAR